MPDVGCGKVKVEIVQAARADAPRTGRDATLVGLFIRWLAAESRLDEFANRAAVGILSGQR